MTDNKRHVESDDLDDNEVTVQQVRSRLAQLDSDAAEMSAVDLASLRSGTLKAVAQEFPATAERKPTDTPANAQNSAATAKNDRTHRAEVPAELNNEEEHSKIPQNTSVSDSGDYSVRCRN